MSNSLFPPKWKENTKGAKKQLGVIRKKADEGDVTEEVRKLNPFFNPIFLSKLVNEIEEDKKEKVKNLLITERCSEIRELLGRIKKKGKETGVCIYRAKESLEFLLGDYTKSLESMGTSEKELNDLIKKGKDSK